MPRISRSLEEYLKLITKEECQWCGKDLPQKIDYYEHPNGWLIDGVHKFQWLSIHCRHCDYDWSISKLGVPQGV